MLQKKHVFPWQTACIGRQPHPGSATTCGRATKRNGGSSIRRANVTGGGLHPANLTVRPLKVGNPKRKLIFQPSFFRGYVKFRGTKFYRGKFLMPCIRIIQKVNWWKFVTLSKFTGKNRFDPSTVVLLVGPSHDLTTITGCFSRGSLSTFFCHCYWVGEHPNVCVCVYSWNSEQPCLNRCLVEQQFPM